MYEIVPFTNFKQSTHRHLCTMLEFIGILTIHFLLAFELHHKATNEDPQRSADRVTGVNLQFKKKIRITLEYIRPSGKANLFSERFSVQM